MSEASAKKMAEELDHDDHDALDDTMPLPALERMLVASDEMLNEAGQSPEDTGQVLMISQLRLLVELSESIDGRLRQIAELLAEQRPKKRSAASRKKSTRTRRGRAATSRKKSSG